MHTSLQPFYVIHLYILKPHNFHIRQRKHCIKLKIITNYFIADLHAYIHYSLNSTSHYDHTWVWIKSLFNHRNFNNSNTTGTTSSSMILSEHLSLVHAVHSLVVCVVFCLFVGLFVFSLYFKVRFQITKVPVCSLQTCLLIASVVLLLSFE
jgi:hypothetical protein